jgi:hypothetical protein
VFHLTLTGQPELEAQLLRIKSQDLPRVTAAAIRYAANSAPAIVSKQMRQHYQLPAPRIKRDVVPGRVGPMATSAQVKLNRRPVTVAQFGARQIGTRRPRRGLGRGRGWAGLKSSRRHGLSWRIFRGQRRSFTPYGFIGKAAQGGQLPYLRRKDGSLSTVYGPSIRQAFLRGEHAEPMRAAVSKQLVERLEVGLRRGIGRFGRR